MTNYTDYFGIDVSKETFDVTNKEGKHLHYSNNKKGFLKFHKMIPKGSLCLMEATGIYHLCLAKFLHSKEIATSVVNPLRIKRFSQMHLRRNKTDKADSLMISKYAQSQDVELWTPAPLEIEQCKDIYQIMEQYIEFKSGLKNKLDALKSKQAPKVLIESINSQIEHMTNSINKLQAEVDELVKDYDSTLLSNITSIVGIGQRTAGLLIVATEAFRSFDNSKQLCSFFGLDPTETSSGTSINGKRKISKMGNPLVRKKLYMCSLQASRFNKTCNDLYRRLLAKGKPKKLALIAVANKLLKIVFAIAKSGLPYDRECKSSIAIS
ncbi:MAG: IS110 family transposase [Bacteroidales bacterium]|jgi:transposase|nr:IS110 family transposase [Bacteroidales bacterium]